MADKGLVSKSALTAIADAIRAKIDTSETMLPGEMAALIAGIKGYDVRYGFFTHTESTNTFNIGPDVPQGDMIIMVMAANLGSNNDSYIRSAWRIVNGNERSGKVGYGASGAVIAKWSIDPVSGDVSVQDGNAEKTLSFATQREYLWIFAGGAI